MVSVYRRGSRRFSKKKSLFSRFSLTNWLIIVNVITFFLFLIVIAFNENNLGLIAIQPSLILEGQGLWTFITSMFMHAGGVHLFVNMFTLFFLGNFSERLIGKKRLFLLYMAAGILGAIAFVGFAYLGTFVGFGDKVFGSPEDFAVGASGALFGLLGLLAVLVPRHSVFLILGPLVLIILQVIISPFLSGPLATGFYFISTLLIFLMIFAMFSRNQETRKWSVPVKMPLWVAPIAAIVPLVFVSFFVKLPIGNTAHFGGLVAGLIYGFYLRRKYPKKIRLLGRMLR